MRTTRNFMIAGVALPLMLVTGSASARFLSADPVTVDDEGDLRHFNRYAYAYNSPYAYTDPDGRAPHIVIGGGVGAFFGGGMELYRQLSTEGRVSSWATVGIETAKGGAVGAMTAAVPGSASLAFGGAGMKTVVGLGNAAVVGAAGEVGAQLAKGESIDARQALIAGASNSAGFGAGRVLATPAKVLSTTTIPGSAGVPVTSLTGRVFVVGATPHQPFVDGLQQQFIQDVGAAGAATITTLATEENR